MITNLRLQDQNWYKKTGIENKEYTCLWYVQWKIISRQRNVSTEKSMKIFHYDIKLHFHFCTCTIFHFAFCTIPYFAVLFKWILHGIVWLFFFVESKSRKQLGFTKNENLVSITYATFTNFILYISNFLCTLKI